MTVGLGLYASVDVRKEAPKNGMPTALVSVHTSPVESTKYTVLNAVTADAFRVIKHIVEHRQSPEVRVVAGFVRWLGQLRDVEASHWGRRSGRLVSQFPVLRSEDLRTRTNNDADRLGIAAIAAVTGHVDHIRAAGVVPNRRAAIIAAVSVRLRKVQLPVLIDLCH